MRSLIRIVIFLVIIAAAGYGGVRGYTWYKVKKEVDYAVQQVAPFADVTYKSIYVSPQLDGTVGVDSIVIRPKMSPDEFTVQSVRFSFGNLLQLIKTKKKEMPNEMHLSLTGVNVDLNSPLLISLNQMQQQNASSSGGFGFDTFETLGCGDVDTIGLDELTRMGYSTMEMDLEMNYQYEKIKNLLDMDMALRLKGMQSVKMKAQMRVAPSDVLQVRKIKPVIDYMQFEVSDAGYAAMRNRFCAAQIQGNEEMYIARHIQLLSRAIGAALPAETVKAYKQYMQGNGHMSIEMEPSIGIEWDSLDAYAPKDAIELVGLKVKIDKHEVDFSKLGWGQSSVVNSAAGDDVDEDGAGNAEQSVVKIPEPARYRATAPSQLKRFIGSQVKLKTDNGMRREGVIENVNGTTVTIRMQASSKKGSISFPVHLADIVSAEVLY